MFALWDCSGKPTAVTGEDLERKARRRNRRNAQKKLILIRRLFSIFVLCQQKKSYRVLNVSLFMRGFWLLKKH